ncbi:MAG: Crp/Fnr family transcriptional regulator [Anaerovoracaceae bacterium]|jgi:CRP-like cAMP-binding protein
MKYIKQIELTLIGQHLTSEEIKKAYTNQELIVRSFGKGQCLYHEGDKCHHLGILLKGRLLGMQTDDSGNEFNVNVIGVNQIIGGTILFGTNPKYPASYFSVVSGELLQIDKSFLFQLFIEKPLILEAYLNIISDRAHDMLHQAKLAARRPLRASILDYLCGLKSNQDSSIVTLPISKTELANMLGVQRTSVSREFSRMEKDGLLEIINPKTIFLKHPCI